MHELVNKIMPSFPRIALGLIFVYAGLDKLFSSTFFVSSNPASIHSQMHAAAQMSPIHALVAHLLPYANLLGALIGMGEFSAGLAVALGYKTRLFAVLGMMLSLSFWLTINYGLPLYLNPDLYSLAIMVWVLWTRGGDWSVDAWIRRDPDYPDYRSHGAPPDEAVGILRRQMVAGGGFLALVGATGLLALARSITAPPSSGTSTVAGGPGAWTTGPNASASPAGNASPPPNVRTQAPGGGGDGGDDGGGAPPPPSAQPSPSASSSSGGGATGQLLATESQFVSGSVVYITHNGSSAMIQRLRNGKYVGWYRWCPHAGAWAVQAGNPVDVCSAHQSKFNPATGVCVDGPAFTSGRGGSPGKLRGFSIKVVGTNIYAA